nr:hypothetical protein BaRGS_032947 [Batillaria attramentaria]
MAVFDTASKFVLQAGQSPGLALMMLMVFADYVAGDVTFHCPCDVTEYGWNSAQQYYAVTFLLSPGFTILVVDARWGLCRAWRNWRNSFIMLYRPLVLCTTWIFYFLASKRFSHCFDKTMACICDDEETKTGCTTSTKVHQAYIQLTVACMLWAILCFAMWATGACRRRGSKQERREFADTLEELVKFGLSPWTVVTLYEQGLIHEPKDHPLLLLSVEDEEVKRLPVTIGQLELVRQYRKIRQKQRQYADGVKGKEEEEK